MPKVKQDFIRIEHAEGRQNDHISISPGGFRKALVFDRKDEPHEILRQDFRQVFSATDRKRFVVVEDPAIQPDKPGPKSSRTVDPAPGGGKPSAGKTTASRPGAKE